MKWQMQTWRNRPKYWQFNRMKKHITTIVYTFIVIVVNKELAAVHMNKCGTCWCWWRKDTSKTLHTLWYNIVIQETNVCVNHSLRVHTQKTHILCVWHLSQDRLRSISSPQSLSWRGNILWLQRGEAGLTGTLRSATGNTTNSKSLCQCLKSTNAAFCFLIFMSGGKISLPDQCVHLKDQTFLFMCMSQRVLKYTCISGESDGHFLLFSLLSTFSFCLTDGLAHRAEGRGDTPV